MSKESALAQIGAVSSRVGRVHIEKVIHEFFASYPATCVDDVLPRAALFAEDATIEDPVGADAIAGKREIGRFFRETVESGWIIHMVSEKTIVCGNEAISLTRAAWGKGDVAPAHVDIVHNFVFNDEGLICRVRVFFDQGTIR